MHFLPEIHELTVLCAPARCHKARKIQSSAISHSNSHHPLSHMVQDFKINIRFTVTPGDTIFL
jgi:hypothetical protein